MYFSLFSLEREALDHSIVFHLYCEVLFRPCAILLGDSSFSLVFLIIPGPFVVFSFLSCFISSIVGPTGFSLLPVASSSSSFAFFTMSAVGMVLVLISTFQARSIFSITLGLLCACSLFSPAFQLPPNALCSTI